MLRRIVRLAIWLAMIVVGLVLIVDVLYFVHGSLEMFPTEERQVSLRLMTGIFAVLLLSVEVGLWVLLRRLGSTSPSRGAPAAPRHG